MNIVKSNIFSVVAAVLLMPLLWACESKDAPEPSGNQVPEGMVEIRPALPGVCAAIPRKASDAGRGESRAYDDNDVTNGLLLKNPTQRLEKGATVWLIAEDETTGKLVKKSYVVFNPEEEELSYLLPCSVNDDGEMIDIDGSPLYLEDHKTYLFYAVSPARKLDEEKFKAGDVAFQIKNGEAFYANDCRYFSTTPQPVKVESTNSEGVQVVKLAPMINQTARLKFRIRKKEGGGVHDLDIQPSGIQISGLQDDVITEEDDAAGTEKRYKVYGDENGIYWHMSQSVDDEPIKLQHADKSGTFHCYDYTIDENGYVNLEVPVLPMWGISKPVIVIFRLKVNGVPTSYEMMLNEKDFKAGYSYGYRGEVSIKDNITVITWQFVSWETDIELPAPIE